jgi:integrase
MTLTDTAIRRAKPKDKPYKLGDSLGLFLLVQPSGGRLWRLKYRVNGSEKKLGLGIYPEVSLCEARAKRDDARKVIAIGSDPAVEKQRAKVRAQISASHVFADIAREFIEKRRADGLTAATLEKAGYFLGHLTPSLGHLPVSEIQPSDVLFALKRIEAKGNLETARRTLQFASRVFCYAVATTRLASDPTRDLRGALIAPKSDSFAALTDPQSVGALMRAIDGYDGSFITQIALKLAAHTFVRPGELRHARWEEFDIHNATWTIPPEKMKMRKPHWVPLSRQSLDFLSALHTITGRPQGFLFPSIRTTSRAMSENTVGAALRRLGYTSDQMTGHGFRSTASTLLNESRKWNPDAIERALAHGHTDSVRGIYDRSQHWDERVAMSQWWSDYLDQLQKMSNEAGAL